MWFGLSRGAGTVYNMATSLPQMSTLIELFVCPVCKETYKDPYILKCGHHFCRTCLQGVADAHPRGFVKCPSCREVTEFGQGSGVTDLPRPVLINELQERISAFLQTAKQEEVVRYCDICKGGNIPATSHCYQCRKTVCSECREKHTSLETKAAHRVVPIAESIFCRAHTEEVASIFCTDCKQCVCPLCLFETHHTHNVVDISVKARETRQRFREFLDAKIGLGIDHALVENLQEKLKRARDTECELRESVAGVRALLREYEFKLGQVERESENKLKAAIKTLVTHESAIKEWEVSNQSLIDHAIYLMEKASDQELLCQENAFPFSRLNVSCVDLCSVEFPVLDDTFQTQSTVLQQLIADCKMHLKKEKVVDPEAVVVSKRKLSFTVGCRVFGIAFDVRRHRLVARTNDASGPLKVYDYQGHLQESLGAGVAGLAGDGQWRGICIDTRRDCFLAPYQSSLVLLNRAGQLIKSVKAVKVGGHNTCGVAYARHCDTYVMSDWNQNIIHLVDPTTFQVVRQFGSSGCGPTQFQNPYNIHVGNVSGVKSPVILVSDYRNNCVKLFEMSGQHVRTYGSPGTGDGQLDQPWSVCADDQGHVIVSDYGNNRIVRFWTDEGGEDRWESVLSNDWGEQNTWYMALDPTNKVIAVVPYGNFDTVHLYNYTGHSK